MKNQLHNEINVLQTSTGTILSGLLNLCNVVTVAEVQAGCLMVRSYFDRLSLIFFCLLGLILNQPDKPPFSTHAEAVSVRSILILTAFMNGKFDGGILSIRLPETCRCFLCGTKLNSFGLLAASNR
jgi:hypothetical protein